MEELKKVENEQAAQGAAAEVTAAERIEELEQEVAKLRAELKEANDRKAMYEGWWLASSQNESKMKSDIEHMFRVVELIKEQWK